VFAFTYPISFEESGLPANTNWTVTLEGTAHSATSATITFEEPNGSYTYAVAHLTGYLTPAPASVRVAGSSPMVQLEFQPLTYTVTFNEYGLPAPSTWVVTIGGTAHPTSSASLTLLEPNGSYDYQVNPIPGYETNWSGRFTVAGPGASVDLRFLQVIYRVSIVETGLPAGTNWELEIGPLNISSVNGSASVSLPNGTYTYVAGSENGFVTPSPGSVTIAGSSPAPIDLLFAPNAAAPTFLGLPANDGYALLSGLVIVGVAAAALVYWRRRKGGAGPSRLGEGPEALGEGEEPEAPGLEES